MFIFFLIHIKPLIAYADYYKVNVTRKSSNIYKVTGKEIYIFTKYCYEYVYYSDAILDMHGYTGSIIFLEENQKCDVTGVYGPVELPSGTYEIKVTYRSDNWYEVFGTDIMLKISLCLKLSILEEAILKVYPGNSAKIIFNDGSEYLVDGIFVRLLL